MVQGVQERRKGLAEIDEARQYNFASLSWPFAYHMHQIRRKRLNKISQQVRDRHSYIQWRPGKCGWPCWSTGQKALFSAFGSGATGDIRGIVWRTFAPTTFTKHQPDLRHYPIVGTFKLEIFGNVGNLKPATLVVISKKKSVLASESRIRQGRSDKHLPASCMWDNNHPSCAGIVGCKQGKKLAIHGCKPRSII